MRLYLVRHAEAAPGEPDELRALTEEGHEAARLLGERLRDEGAKPVAVVTSPLLRARQTGDALARALQCPASADERLAPGAEPEEVLAVATGRAGDVVVVGHQPDCGRVAATVTGSEPKFPPAGVVPLDIADA